MTENKSEWRRLQPDIPILNNLQMVADVLKYLIGNIIAQDAARIKAMTEHIMTRPEMKAQLSKTQLAKLKKENGDLAGL